MARIEAMRLRLENWARWVTQPVGPLGYPRQSTFMRFIPADKRDGATVPMLALEAEETDRAIKSLQLKRSHLYLVLQLHYAKGLPIHRVAHQMGRAESTVKANLEQADRAILTWLDEQLAAKNKLREVVNAQK